MQKTFIVETSARHAHLSEKDLATLFGEGYKLTNKKDLSQPGQFACEERITAIGTKGEIKNISILGPTRPDTQLEVSLTDARTLGVAAPIVESGNIKGSAGCKLIGPKGEVEIAEGVIAAKRHIHMTTADAAEIGVKDKDIVCVKVDAEQCGRPIIYCDTVVRVNDNFALAMHVDIDEANAAALRPNSMGYII